MTDSGVVISTTEGFAKVEVECLIESCHKCAARNLCGPQKQTSTGYLTVKNPLQAAPGDLVRIKIPETQYNKALILIFGTLLLGCIAGTSGGYFLSSILSLASSVLSFLGLLLGILITGIWLFLYFRKKNKERLYPIIIDILKKGDSHG